MNKFINSELFKKLLDDQKIVILDGGARGDLFEPFDKVTSDVLIVVKVEPDSSALVENKNNEIVLNKAIWKVKEKISIHIANEPSVSSVFPPNLNFASRFIDIIGKPARTTREIIEVDGSDIDSIFEEHGINKPDFIKLDIHGCEYEALQGAKISLEENTIGLLVESWLIEAHENQKLAFNVDEFLHQFGFYPFETNIGVWPFMNSSKLFSKGQNVISESFYMKDIVHRGLILEKIQLLKLIAIADLFGFSSYCIILVDYGLNKNIFNKDLANEINEFITNQNKLSKFKTLKIKLIDKVIDFLIKFK